jgi:hypothetical protein
MLQNSPSLEGVGGRSKKKNFPEPELSRPPLAPPGRGMSGDSASEKSERIRIIIKTYYTNLIK